MVEPDVTFWALALLMKANVKITKNDRKQILLTICLFQVIADGFYFFRFPWVASMSSENQDLRHHRSDVLLCAYPRAAASPTCQGIPTLHITARFPFSAPAPSRPRRLLSRLAGLWTQINATPGRGPLPHFCSSRNSVIQLVIQLYIQTQRVFFKCKDTKKFLIGSLSGFYWKLKWFYNLELKRKLKWKKTRFAHSG